MGVMMLIVFASLFISMNSWSFIYTRNILSRHTGLKMIIPSGGGDKQRQPQAPLAPINELIKADKVRLIVPGNNTGEDVMIGVFPIAEALEKAADMEMDLVLINDKAEPPVCKIIDYGKYKYSQEKKKKENSKKQVKVDVKEVKMSYKIDQHDFDVRLRAIQKFIGEGDRVKVIIQFKGREMQLGKDLGKELLMKIFQPMEEIAMMESNPKIEGKAIMMLLGPKK